MDMHTTRETDVSINAYAVIYWSPYPFQSFYDFLYIIYILG